MPWPPASRSPTPAPPRRDLGRGSPASPSTMTGHRHRTRPSHWRVWRTFHVKHDLRVTSADARHIRHLHLAIVGRRCGGRDSQQADPSALPHAALVHDDRRVHVRGGSQDEERVVVQKRPLSPLQETASHHHHAAGLGHAAPAQLTTSFRLHVRWFRGSRLSCTTSDPEAEGNVSRRSHPLALTDPTVKVSRETCSEGDELSALTMAGPSGLAHRSAGPTAEGRNISRTLSRNSHEKCPGPDERH